MTPQDKIRAIQKQIESLYSDLAKIAVEDDVWVEVRPPAGQHSCHVVTPTEFKKLDADLRGDLDLDPSEPLLDSHENEITVGRWISSSQLCW
jgi:hypothetical protein